MMHDAEHRAQHKSRPLNGTMKKSMIREDDDSAPGLAKEQDAAFRRPLTRFRRNRCAPAELEDLRYKLIWARIMNGLQGIEAARQFGYANSSQLSQIESGERPTPSDWKFLRRAAEVYAVSTDWLLGLSPNMEQDARLIREHALLRGTENLVRGFIDQMASALIETARQTHSTEEELNRVLQHVDEVAVRFEKYASQPAFQDMPGGAPVDAAVKRLRADVEPLRRKLEKIRAVEVMLAQLKEGNLVPPERLGEFLGQREKNASGVSHDVRGQEAQK